MLDLEKTKVRILSLSNVKKKKDQENETNHNKIHFNIYQNKNHFKIKTDNYSLKIDGIVPGQQ